MRLPSRLTLLSLLSLCLVPSIGRAQTFETATEEDLTAHAEKLRSGGDLSVDFVQETLTLRGRIRIGRGSALFGLSDGTKPRDGRFYWRTDEPHRERWMFNGELLARLLPETGEATVWPKDEPFANDMRRIVELVTGFQRFAIGADVRSMRLNLGGGVPHTYYEINPRLPGDFKQLTILVDEDQNFVRVLEMHFASGQVTRFTFSGARRMMLPDDAFEMGVKEATSINFDAP